MFCKMCNQQYAEFSEKDYKFVTPHGKIKMFFSRITFNLIKRNGFYPKHQQAGWDRAEAFFREERKGFCSSDCEGDYNRMTECEQDRVELKYLRIDLKEAEKKVCELKEYINLLGGLNKDKYGCIL